MREGGGNEALEAEGTKWRERERERERVQK